MDDALAQLPVEAGRVIVRTDSAGCSHAFLETCRARQVRVVVGHALTVDVANVIVNLPDAVWQPAVSADGAEWRDHAEVADLTHLVDLSGWPSGMRMIARREDPHPGAQVTFTDVNGHRFQVFLTDLDDPDIAYLEALYRGRSRAERQICDLRATGLTNLPSHTFAINQAWLQLALCAHDLLAWTRRLTLDGDPATAEPKRLRYCLFHTAGQLVTTGRRRICRLADDWPWTPHLLTAFDRLHTLPLRS